MIQKNLTKNDYRNLLLLASDKIKMNEFKDDEKFLDILYKLEPWCINKYPDFYLVQRNLMKDYLVGISIQNGVLHCVDFATWGDWEEEVRQEKEAHYKEVFGA